MTVLMQTHWDKKVSFTCVAEDIMRVNSHIDWEKGDFYSHIPSRSYSFVFYVGSCMMIDVSRFYRYMFWTNRHVYYGVVEGPPVLDYFCRAALMNMEVYVPSQYVKWELENAGFKVRGVVPHGVDIGAINSADYRKWKKIFGDKVVVLYVAHRNIRKGFRELIEAWRMSRAGSDSNVLLVLHTSSVPNYVSGEEWVDFSGNVFVTENILKFDRETLFGLYRAADVYVHSGLCEGFGIPIVEAMAAGKPVICIDAPPMNEHVVDSECLVRVDRQVLYNDRGYSVFRMNIPDLKDFAEKIDWMVYGGPSVWNEYGERNKSRAINKYGLKNYRVFGGVYE